MKRVLALLLFAASLSSACIVGRHGHVSAWVPPALFVAAAVAATARPGYVWVDGHWDWNDDGWVWSDGFWMEERPGFFWVQGLWFGVDGGYRWRPGYWRPSSTRVEVHPRR